MKEIQDYNTESPDYSDNYHQVAFFWALSRAKEYTILYLNLGVSGTTQKTLLIGRCSC